MSIVTAPTGALEGISRKSLFEKLAVSTGLLQVGTATGGTQATLIDTSRLKSTQYDSSEWTGGWVRISSTTDGQAPLGEIAPIPDYQPELGVVKLDPYMSAIIEAGDTYELWRVDPNIIKSLVDGVLIDTLYIPFWSILSEIPDFDMELATKLTWTDVNATSVKASTTPVSSGQYLSVTTSVANGYTKTDTFGVEPGRSVYYGAAVRPNSGVTAKLILWDETNSVEISSKTHLRQYPLRIYKVATIPSNCYSASIRLSCTAIGLVDWDDIMFYVAQSEDIALPSYIKQGGQVKGVFSLWPRGVEADLYDITLAGELDQRFDIRPGRPFRAKARTGMLSSALFIFGTKNETAYSNDTELKYLDADMFVACVKWKLLEYLSQPIVSGILDSARAREDLKLAYGEYMLLAQQQADEMNKVLRSPTPSGRFLDERFRYGA